MAIRTSSPISQSYLPFLGSNPQALEDAVPHGDRVGGGDFAYIVVVQEYPFDRQISKATVTIPTNPLSIPQRPQQFISTELGFNVFS